MKAKVTYLGGPSYLIEVGNFRLLSDPAFDPQGSSKLEGPGHLLTKVMEPPIPAEEIGHIDAVLVSHAHHLDNFDQKGREVASKAGVIITNNYSVNNIEKGNTVGLDSWDTYKLENDQGESLTITSTPAVHTDNPDIRDAVGEVTGFMLEWEGQDGAFWISGDTVYVPELEEIARRYKVGAAILHMGAANVPAVGDSILTLTAEAGVKVVNLFKLPKVYPGHFEGWRHFTEGSWIIERTFEKAGIIDALHLLKPGESATVPV